MTSGNRPLDLQWLEDFLALAETGNFSRAAQARAMAQPALSRHIRALEEWVGVDLIDRSEHPVALTAAGASLLPQVQQLLASLQAARIKAKAAHDQEGASLRFACTHALSLTFFPRWLASLETSLRLGPVQTMSDSFQGCLDLMNQRLVQFLLCYAHSSVSSQLDEECFPVQILGHDQLVPVSASDAKGEALYRLSDAGVVPILDYSDASALGRILKATMANRRHGNVSVVFTAHNAFLLKTMVLQGRGVAWLPHSLVAQELGNSSLHMAAPPAWQVPIEIRLYRQQNAMNTAAESLWNCTQASIDS
jgi:LysR family transcriptional regulator, hypochlorite-specific transcription factor HypT